MPRFVFVKPSLSGPLYREQTAIDSMLSAAEQAGFESRVAVAHSAAPLSTAFERVELPVGSDPSLDCSPSFTDRVKSLLTGVLGLGARESRSRVAAPTPASDVAAALETLSSQLPLCTGDVVATEIETGMIAELAQSLREVIRRSPAQWHLLLWKETPEALSEEQTRTLAEWDASLPNVRFFADSEQAAIQLQQQTGVPVEFGDLWRSSPSHSLEQRSILCLGRHGDGVSDCVAELRDELKSMAADWRLEFCSCNTVVGPSEKPDLLVLLPVEENRERAIPESWQGIPLVAPSSSKQAKEAAQAIVDYHLEIFDRNCFVGAACLLEWVQQGPLGEELSLSIPNEATHALLSLEAPAIYQADPPVMTIKHLDSTGRCLRTETAVFAANGDLATTLVRVPPRTAQWRLKCSGDAWRSIDVKSATIDLIELEGDLPLSRSGVFYDSESSLPAAVREVLGNWSRYSTATIRAGVFSSAGLCVRSPRLQEREARNAA